MLKERKISYLFFFNFRIYFLILHLFKLFEYLKYVVIYTIGRLCNFYSFSNCEILKICYLSILNNFRNLLIFENVKFGKFLEFSRLKFFGIFKVANFSNFPNWKINKILEFFHFGKPKFG